MFYKSDLKLFIHLSKVSVYLNEYLTLVKIVFHAFIWVLQRCVNLILSNARTAYVAIYLQRKNYKVLHLQWDLNFWRSLCSCFLSKTHCHVDFISFENQIYCTRQLTFKIQVDTKQRNKVLHPVSSSAFGQSSTPSHRNRKWTHLPLSKQSNLWTLHPPTGLSVMNIMKLLT